MKRISLCLMCGFDYSQVLSRACAKLKDLFHSSVALILGSFPLHFSNMIQKRKLVTRMLAVGEIPSDAIRRVTRGDSYTCCMGSENEHQRLAEFCQALQDLLASTGQQLSDYSPDDLRVLLTKFIREEDAGE